MTKEKKNKTLKEMLGAEAYLEYKCDTDAIIKKQTKIADKQVGIVTQRVEDKFERRLIEEFSKFRTEQDQRFNKVDDRFNRMNEKFDKKFDNLYTAMMSQTRWMLSFMLSQTGLILGVVYFLLRH